MFHETDQSIIDFLRGKGPRGILIEGVQHHRNCKHEDLNSGGWEGTGERERESVCVFSFLGPSIA
jgi:hypothetical protein